MNALNAAEPRLADIAPVLDEVINELGDEDRQAILLRFYERRDLRSVGEALGSSENAAQKRVTRALDQLHLLLTRRGVALSAAALGTVLASEALTAAPAGLAASIAGAAVVSAAATGGGTLTALKIMNITNFKLVALSGIAIVAVATPLAQHQSLNKLREENRSLQRQVDQNAKLREENQRLSNLVAQASSGQSFAQEQMRELLRLRGEVGRLRQENKEIERLREEIRQLRVAQAQLTPVVGAELRIARQKLSDLRDRYSDQHPEVQEQLRAIESLERSAAATEPPELAQAKAELARLRASYSDAHPAVQSQLRKIAELER